MSSTDARGILDCFLARMDRGELPEFDALLRAHPEHAAELVRLFEDECARLEAASPPSIAARIAKAPGTTTPGIPADVVARLAGRGANFGRYSIRGAIGQGGMGDVLRVWDADLRRELAMKVTRDDAAGRESSSEASRSARFLEEAQVTSQLDHPGIVPVHELGLDPSGRLYFTMKLVKGRTFAQVLDLVHENADGWTQARALVVIQRVCEAMAYAHDKGVLHRDLKPANVMVGAFGEVYVMDWGLARVADAPVDADPESLRSDAGRPAHVGTERAARRSSDPASALNTRDGQVVGTPAYMPPEQAAGRLGDVGPHSDVYAVGAMLHHLLAGRPPRSQLARESSGATDALPAFAPTELAAICDKAMAHDWRARYRDMRELAHDLSAYLEGRVVRAHETGALAEARKWVTRNRAVATSLAAVLLALVAGLVVSLALQARADASTLSARKLATFLEDTLAGAKPSIALGRDTTMLREMLDGARARLDAGELAAAPEAELRLLHWIGGTYREIARYDLAEPLLRLAVERARNEIARDDPLRATIVSELALLLDAQGASAEADRLAREALDDRRRAHPGDHAAVASSLQNLASVLRTRGEFAEAELRLREAVAMHERLSPADAQGLALSLNNLSVVLEQRGEREEAQVCAQRALELSRRSFPAGHPLVASNANVLATLLAARGDLHAAEVLHRETLELRRRMQPGDHPDTAASLNNLAFTLYQQRDCDGAEPHFREALAMQRRLIGRDHVDLAATLDNLAATRLVQGDATECEALQLEALEMRRRLFPEGHADVALGLHNLAAGLRRRGELERAERFAREALEVGRRCLPAEHEYLVSFANNLGLVLEARGDLEGAEQQFRAALEVCERREASSPETADGRRASCEIHVARILLRRGRFADAETWLARPQSATDERGRVERLKLWVELHTAWEQAEPGRGHAQAALERQRELDAAASR